MTEEKILAMIQTDSQREQGFRLLMNHYQEMLYQHIRRIVKNHEDTNDVLQNTFIKVYRHIGKFQEKSSLYTWIYRIATNESLTHINKSKRMRVINHQPSEDQGLENKISAENGPEAERINHWLIKALDTLPEKQRAVFGLRYYEEKSYKEISSIMGTSEGALKASYHHAVKKVENYFKKANIY